MENQENEVKNIYDNLSNENKEVLNLLAKGMQIAQENGKVNFDSIKEK